MADNTAWEQETLQKLLLETLKEQRRKRRWGIFFKLAFLALIIFSFFWASHSHDSTLKRSKPHTAMINIHGIIDSEGQASADEILSVLKDVYDDGNAQAIILRINSPGGSPVQAAYIYNEILRQRALHKAIPIYAVCEDVCASAAYYIASSAQNIYANQASLVGSIGALINGFGFVDAMQKVGVQRRLITSGSDKGFLDPFSPLKKSDEVIAQTMLDEVHQQFIHDVKRGRGQRLKIDDQTFSGRAWTGIGAKAQGLIDGFGSVDDVARNVVKNSNVVCYNPDDDFLSHLTGKFGTEFRNNVLSQLSPRLS